LENLEHQFARCVNNGARQQWRKRPVSGHTRPAFAVGSLLAFHECFHRLLPGAGGQAAVRAGQIGFGDLEVEHRLALGDVLGLNDLRGLVRVGRAQAGAASGLGVNTVKGSSPDAASN